MTTLDIGEGGGRIVAVIRRFVEEVDSCSGNVGVGTVNEIEFVAIGKECAEVCFEISISILNMTTQGRINLVPVWDLNILALVPFPWRQRNLILGHWTTIKLNKSRNKMGIVGVQSQLENGKRFQKSSQEK
jgi:hypothetical protein